MDLKELNEWIETTEGAAWLDEQKTPLIEKRDELLAKVKELNETHRTSAQSVDDLTATLANEREDFRRELIDRDVSNFIDRHVVPGLREGAKALFTGLDITVKADGKQRIPMVSKENLEGLPLETEAPDGLPLSDYLDAWAKTEDAMNYLKAPENSGGGALGGARSNRSTSEEDAFTKAVLDKL